MIPQIFYQIGYAICHQLPERSFFVYGEQMPLCARCTGIYLGIFIAFSIYFFTKIIKNKKHILPPPFFINILSISFIILMAAQAISGIFIVYPFDKEIRFITGILFGISMPWYLLLTVNYSKRFKFENKEILNYKKYLTLSIAAIIITAAFLFKISFLLYIFSLISIVGLLIFINLINFSILLLSTEYIKKLKNISLYYILIFSLILSSFELLILNIFHKLVVK